MQFTFNGQVGGIAFEGFEAEQGLYPAVMMVRYTSLLPVASPVFTSVAACVLCCVMVMVGLQSDYARELWS